MRWRKTSRWSVTNFRLCSANGPGHSSRVGRGAKSEGTFLFKNLAKGEKKNKKILDFCILLSSSMPCCVKVFERCSPVLFLAFAPRQGALRRLFSTCIIFIALNTREAGRKYLVKLIEFLFSFFSFSTPPPLRIYLSMFFNDSAAVHLYPILLPSSERENTRKPIKMCSTPATNKLDKNRTLNSFLEIPTHTHKNSHKRLLLDTFFLFSFFLFLDNHLAVS